MTDISTAPTAGLLARLSAPAAIRIGLLLYGLLLAGLSVQRLDVSVPDQPTLMGTRSEGVAQSMRALETGGPPLLGCPDGFNASRPLDGCVPVGISDDQGLYLVLPLLAESAGFDTPEEALKWFYILLFGLLALVSPLIFYSLFGSIAAALFAPAAIVFHFDFFADTDIYWIGAWCYLFAIPLVLLVYKRWGRFSLLPLAGLVAVGSFVSSIRIHSGLPILLSALLVVLLRRRSFTHLALSAVALFLAYLTFAGVLTAAREYRDHRVGDPGLSERYPTRHPFWHNAYIGLGYLPNRYGIEWNDTVSAEFVRRQDPSVVYLSPQYERILRDEYFRILRENPRLVLNNIVAKVGLTLDAARDRFGIVLLLAPLAMFIGRARHEWRRYLLIASPMLLLSLPPPVLTLPVLVYQLTWLGAWATLWLLLCCWALAELPRELRARMSGAAGQRLREDPVGAARAGALAVMRSPAPWLALVLIVTVGVVADMLGPRAERLGSEDFWRGGAAALSSPAGSSALQDWQFSTGMPRDWSVMAAAAAVPIEGALRVVTSEGRFEYQLTGPAIVLSAGSYEVRAQVDLTHGGVELGALDHRKNVWLATSHYWHGQSGFARSDLVTRFTLSKSTKVRVILSNWHARPQQSEWDVRRVWIRRA